MKATLKSILILICVLLSINNSKAATLYFNNLYQASGSGYVLNTVSYTSITSVAGSNFKFTSANPADVTFSSGNNENGILSYTNNLGVLVQFYGTISRQAQVSGTTTAVNFLPTDNTYTTLTGSAYLLIVQGQEASFTNGQSVSTSSNPVDPALNLMLSSQNTAPTITSINPLSFCANTSSTSQSFTVSDVETVATSLNVTASSSNTTLVPNANITLGGSGGSRTIVITPAANQSGTTTITVSVTDGGGSTSTTSFLVTVSLPKFTGSTGTVSTANTGSQVVVDGAIVVNETNTINGAKVSITTNFNAGDVLATTTTLPTGVTSSYGTGTGILTISGTMTPAQLQTILQGVKFSTTSASVGNRVVTFTMGTATPSSNGHYYEYIAYSSTWANAKSNAATKTYLGLQGYLATVGDATENAFITAKLSSDAWFGASDDYLQINAATGTTTYANQTAAEGNWFWVTGPEAGQKFSVGNNTPVTQTGKYANWNPSEPNNSQGSEHYGQYTSSTGGGWNDLNATSTLPGYIVEYGGMLTDGCTNLTSTRTIVVITNQPPTIASISNISFCSGFSKSVTATISDDITPVANLILSASSSNTSLIPNSGITLSGTSGTRTVTFVPSSGQSGTTTITLTCTDGNAASTSITFLVTVNAAPTATISKVDASCSGMTNGSATVTASGGTSPYSYVWVGSSSTTNVASNLATGKVKCAVIDANGCRFPKLDSTVVSTGLVNQSVSSNGSYVYNFTDPIPTGKSLAGVKINAIIYFGFSGAFFAGNGWYITGTNVGGSTVGGSGAMDYPVVVDYMGSVPAYVYGGSNNMTFGNAWNGVTFRSADITLRYETELATTIGIVPIQLTSATTIPAICNNGTVNYTPVVTPAGTTYSWIRPTITGISTASSTGTGNISETLTNTTNNPISVPYTFSLLNNGCLVSQIVSTVVNPTPVITSTLTPSAVTTGNVFNYTVSGSTGATFSWSRATVTGISNASATGTNNISETLVNTTNAPVTVSYVYTITIGSCTNTQTVSVVVNPIPSLTSSLTASTTSGTLYGYTPTSAVTGTTYSWTRAVVLGINNAAGSGTGAISETLINTTANPINVTYIITSTANGVTNTQNLVVTVNPIPVLSSSLTATAISNAAFTYTPTSATTGTTYSWSRATVAGISNAAATGTGAISENLINTTANPINVTYVITLTANGVTNTQNVVVTVNPIPVLTSTLTPAGLCNGSAFTYTPTSATTGTTYSWSRATVVGISNTAASGTGAINETLNNTTANPINVTYVYTLTANGVTNTQSVVVTINAVPTLTSTLSPASICNNATFNYTPTSATTGASFSWSRAAVSGISNTAGTGTGAISEVLTNSTANTLNVVYAITTSANGCNNTQNVTVPVQPTPTLSTSLTATAGSGNPFNYIPNSATTNITAAGWSRAVVAGISNAAASSASGIINETLINTTAAPVVVSYVYTLAIGSCINTQTVNVTVNPRPTLTSGLTATAVNNTPFTYTPTSATTGTTYSWSRAVVAGISNAAATGTGSINETLINTTANPINVTYVITLTANGVTNIQNVVVTVYPTPTLTSSLTPSAVCSGATFNYTPTSATTGTTYSWNRNAVAGISNAAATGTGAISEALVNTTLIPVTVNYDITLSANGVNNTQTVSVVINPLPVLTSGLTPNALCNVSPFFYIPSSGTPGTTYAWSRAAITGISNAAATGTGNIVETINNTTANPITVNYVYTATANGCSNPQTVAIVIKPTPTLSSALSNAPACNNTVFAYTATSATAGTTFAWSRAAVTGISNAAASGTGANISETLVNTTAAPITVTYVITLTANNCTNTQNVTVVVNPTSLLSSTLAPASICNNTAFTYTPTSATNGTTYAWSRAAVAGISNAAATGVAGINETLINTTANPITVNYVYTLTANACTNTTTQTVAVVVKPTPVLSSTLTPAAQCNAQSFNYTATSATAGTNYTWSRAAVAGITPATGSGSSAFILENLVNTTANPLTVNYVVNLNANGCTNTQTFSLTINSTPVLSSTLNAAPVCNNTTFAYTPTTATTGTAFAWSRAAVSGISNAAATGTGAITETLVNTTQTPLVVSYVYVLTANGCSNTQTVNVTVNPTPQLSSLLTTATCNNATFSYTPTSAVAGATYAWSRAAVTGVSNAAATGTGAITETLNNTTANPVVVTYTITLTANGCSSNTQAVNVTVNPTPQLSSSLTTTPICSNTNFAYAPSSATAGTNFAWTRASVAGISNAAGNGMGSINEALVNTTANPVTVNYVYVLTANNCTAIQNFNVTVNPAPSLTSSLAPAGVCSNTAFAYTPTSATAGTTFAWSRAAVAGISNASATGTGAINETLINTAAATVNPKYLVTLTANGCSASQFVQATVYPTPVLSSGLSVAPACSGTETNYTAASATAGTTFAWSRAAVAGISNAAATGTGNIKETLTNTSASPVNVNYVYTLTANTCTNTQTVATTINPKPATPVITALGPTTFCVEESVDLQVATVSGGTYNWYYNGTNLGVNANTATVNLEGDYTATVTNTYGCTSATSAAVSISTPCSAGFAGMPTVFTPNGDGENDMVYAVIPGIKELKNFSIYNRWGNKVFDTQVLGTGWDGKFKDLEQPADVYFWYVEGVDSKGNTLKKQGKITLAR